MPGKRSDEIGPGLLALLAVEKGDAPANAARMVERLLGYRVFSDAEGRMNLSLADTGGRRCCLYRSSSLAADTAKGMRPSFTPAATPEGRRERLFNEVVALANTRHPKVATGVFGAEMSVSLINHGPVTFRLTA